VTFGTSDAFLEHFGLANLGDLPGAQEMRALGLLSLDIPSGFSVPDPTGGGEDEDPLEPGDEPQFHQDFLTEE
jgi:segregation and condensation protein B